MTNKIVDNISVTDETVKITGNEYVHDLYRRHSTIFWNFELIYENKYKIIETISLIINSVIPVCSIIFEYYVAIPKFIYYMDSRRKITNIPSYIVVNQYIENVGILIENQVPVPAIKLRYICAEIIPPINIYIDDNITHTHFCKEHKYNINIQDRIIYRLSKPTNISSIKRIIPSYNDIKSFPRYTDKCDLSESDQNLMFKSKI